MFAKTFIIFSLTVAGNVDINICNSMINNNREQHEVAASVKRRDGKSIQFRTF